MTGGLGASRLFQEPFDTSGTVVAHPFHTTVPWNDWSGTMERFWSKSLRRQELSSCPGWNDQPSERGALAPLSGRFVPIPSLGGTSGTLERSRGLASLPRASVRCPDGAVSKYYRRTKAAPETAEIAKATPEAAESRTWIECDAKGRAA
jgi:hypothetical protein